MNLSCFLWIWLSSFLIGPIHSFQTSGKMINICRIKNGGACIVSDMKASLNGNNYTCENALEPQWYNHRDWASLCSTYQMCSQSIIKIIFEQTFDIAEICIEQRLATANFLLKKVNIFYSNGRNSLHKLDANKFQKCFLLPDRVGEQTNWIKVSLIEGYGSVERGIGSIIAYAYSDDPAQEEDLHYTNFAEISTCSAPHYVGYPCENALNYDNPINYSSDYSMHCNGSSCYNIRYELTFPVEIQPEIICISGRDYGGLTLFSKIQIQWNSGFQQILHFPKNKLRKCFKYEGHSTETGFGLYIKELYVENGGNPGLAYLQVYSHKYPSSKEFEIQSTVQQIYYIPSKILDLSFISFGVKLLNFSANEQCHSFIFELLNATGQTSIKIEMKIPNGSLWETRIFIDGKLSHVIATANSSEHFLPCNTWKDFWISLSAYGVTFGKGRIRGVDILYTENSPLTDNVIKIGVSNTDDSRISVFRVNSLENVKNSDLKINLLHSYSCSQSHALDILKDHNLTTCLSINEYPYTLVVTKQKKTVFGIIKHMVSVILNYQLIDKSSINIYFLLTKDGTQQSKFCFLSTINQLEGDNKWKYNFDCRKNEDIIGQIMITILKNTIPTFPVEVCEVGLI
ncbi:DgyrCDS14864 [Dimorphilus gyrociliatus]|uniref:DgyrCDS14864 n=1 Tax=Dimorphilus gyrociliatus TaxID=2664684 RepID=A0A7I8WFI6_9ANNE|nr:DgyrCDS14864 [Dimorphilus gyrociliatus]